MRGRRQAHPRPAAGSDARSPALPGAPGCGRARGPGRRRPRRRGRPRTHARQRRARPGAGTGARVALPSCAGR
ncbi:MAG: hypothetical protein M3Y04_09830 [Actinomycetota bacterium]|nr:hypothetical protein [Actinomycetota bacterium]